MHEIRRKGRSSKRGLIPPIRLSRRQRRTRQCCQLGDNRHQARCGWEIALIFELLVAPVVRRIVNPLPRPLWSNWNPARAARRFQKGASMSEKRVKVWVQTFKDRSNL